MPYIKRPGARTRLQEAICKQKLLALIGIGPAAGIVIGGEPLRGVGRVIVGVLRWCGTVDIRTVDIRAFGLLWYLLFAIA